MKPEALQQENEKLLVERNALDVQVAALDERVRDLTDALDEEKREHRMAEHQRRLLVGAIKAEEQKNAGLLAMLDGTEHRHESGKVCVACTPEDEKEADRLEAENTRLSLHARSLVDRINDVHSSDDLMRVFETAQTASGKPYCGPTYKAQLDALRIALGMPPTDAAGLAPT